MKSTVLVETEVSTIVMGNRTRRIAVIGDIVSSTKIADRAQVQEKLAGVIRLLNHSNAALDSPYTITLGDEFQAVLSKGNDIFLDAVSILEILHPEKVRFAIGVGTLSTPLIREQAIGMDGPAFHNARSAMRELKRTPHLFKIVGIGNPCSELINHSLCLTSHAARKWKKNRFQILRMLGNEIPVKNIANALGLSDKAIYKAINAEDLRTMLGLFNSVTTIINASLDE